MALKMSGSDYVVGTDGALETVSGSAELLQRLMMRLTARRGAFPLAPQYGSRLHLLASAPKSELKALAEAYAAEALAEEKDVAVTGVSVSEADGALSVTLGLTYGGGSLFAAVSI